MKQFVKPLDLLHIFNNICKKGGCPSQEKQTRTKAIPILPLSSPRSKVSRKGSMDESELIQLSREMSRLQDCRQRQDQHNAQIVRLTNLVRTLQQEIHNRNLLHQREAKELKQLHFKQVTDLQASFRSSSSNYLHVSHTRNELNHSLQDEVKGLKERGDRLTVQILRVQEQIRKQSYQIREVGEMNVRLVEQVGKMAKYRSYINWRPKC